jgi:hypothetical protein
MSGNENEIVIPWAGRAGMHGVISGIKEIEAVANCP